MPAPAIQMLNPCGWWSRPVELKPARSSIAGVRPNSVQNTTTVSSHIPRRFRSVSNPAIGLSTRAQDWACSFLISWCESHSPKSLRYASVNRTPRSVKRRAARRRRP
jgi:hypothetical protein